MEKQNLEIHSENILPIIKKWLYSDKDIFVRELVSNSMDALKKVEILRNNGELLTTDELRVEVRVNKEQKTLTFSDTGIGMNADEVKRYIAQIAFSGAEEFVNKYKDSQEKEQFIGHFGLGFYSAYMVADKVEIHTLSHRPDAEAVFWSCDGSSEYLLDKSPKVTLGTEITLYINDESTEFLEPHHLRELLTRYCSFLPYPVYFEGSLVNSQAPLWIKSPSECRTEEYLEFYRHLYPMEEDPLFWVHLNVDYPFHLKGILYFPKIQRDFDASKNTIKLYCNRVFVSDNCKNVIPDYLMVLRGIIDSPDIPLNVSRSYLQMDKNVRQLAGHISKKVSDSLTTLYKTDKERFYHIWPDVSTVVKLGALEDDKFYDKVKGILLWQNSLGEWTTSEEYLERNSGKTKDKIFYSKDSKANSSFMQMYKDKGIEVLSALSPIDFYLMQHLERKLSPVKFQRIDSAVDESILDKEREKTILDESGRSGAARIADFIRSQLEDSSIEVEAKSLSIDTLPGFIVLDENQRRFRDYMKHFDPSGKGGAGLMKNKFVVNTNNKFIQAIQDIAPKNPELAKELARQTYDLALLAQHEIDPDHLQGFVNRTTHVLEELTSLLQKESV